jgi:hypothetical protein
MGSYVYLISTLPTLHFGLRPVFSFEKFIDYCQRFMAEAEIGILKKASIAGEYNIEASHPMLKKWQEFDTALRNELVKIRASRKHIEPAKYLRRERFPEQSIVHIAISAYRSPFLLEAEKILDQERWRALDEFLLGHYFDLDFLIIYCLKLLILERWERINAADKAQAQEEALKPD